ncbi:hypothetical protein JOC86_000304 [Bacillus pakistanensis]|uniref:Uncharacterized protein n=1 Tax=Rossellomorea pakistanensis TaxID=992288 RepID=A0ABS2N7E0_9BACI|nr:hypothetical protein [Bacillus pakistanensis]
MIPDEDDDDIKLLLKMIRRIIKWMNINVYSLLNAAIM